MRERPLVMRQRMVGSVVAALAAAALPSLTLANFAPTARIEVSTPLPARPGQDVQLVGSASSDPDAGPLPLTYSWDFGDGQASTAPDPAHPYAARGIYLVALTVSDGEATSVATREVPVLEAPGPVPVASSPLALDGAGKLWIANTDSGSVTVLDTASLLVEDELVVGAEPVSLALTRDGSRIVVACRGDGTLRVLDVASRAEVGRVQVGRSPQAVVVPPGGDTALVTAQGDGAVRVVDLLDLTAMPRVIATGGRPRALAVTGDGTRAVVTDFLATNSGGRAWVLDLVTESVRAEVLLGPDSSIDTSSSGRGVPNVLGCVTLEPSGLFAHVGGLKSNVFRGLVRDGRPLLGTNRVRGVAAPFELSTGLERESWRIDTNDADSASAMAFSPDGTLVYIAHRGLGQVSVYDTLAAAGADTTDGSAVPVITRVVVGDAPEGIVLAGSRAYVSCALSRDIAVLDLTDPARPSLVTRVPVTAEPLPPSIANGKVMFTRSARPTHSSQGYVACASCHPDGGHDGMTWDFTDGGEGLRNTTDLRGRAGLAHGPVHWTANFDEVQDFDNDIVFGFGGLGLGFAGDGGLPNPPMGAPNAGRSTDLDDLAVYLATLSSMPPSPFRAPGGSLTAPAQRGREVFYRASTQCASCHVAPRFTDSTLAPDDAAYRLHDVGTTLATSGGRLGGPAVGFDTPTLQLLWDTAPYLHDGRALDLRAVLTDENAADRHGRTSDLGPSEIDDLVAFLLSIDGGPDVGRPAATAAPGEVAPAGEPSLRVDRRGTWLHASWLPVDGAETYVVARGEVGDFASHRVEAGGGACDTAGEVQFFDRDDLADGANRYYLVAARNALGEGSFGVQRPDPDAPPGTGPPRPQRRPTPACP